MQNKMQVTALLPFVNNACTEISPTVVMNQNKPLELYKIVDFIFF